MPADILTKSLAFPSFNHKKRLCCVFNEDKVDVDDDVMESDCHEE